ncbi:uncharacterized protein LOC144906075 [Branchiostoma floridae x Branchiostoma belcheri]
MMQVVFLALAVFTVSVNAQFCNFDHSFCGYTNDPTKPMTWEEFDGNSHGHGHVQIEGSGPSEDHTHQGGHGHGWFAQSDCANNLPGDEAWLVSRELTGTAFLDFWYTMNGGDLDLSVYILQGGQEIQVWNRMNIDNPFWLRGSVALDPPNFYQPYRIAFVTVRGADPLCHVAIDDVNINIVAVPTTPKPPTEAPTTAPTDAPTDAPTEAPTVAATDAPTDAATDAVTDADTVPPQPDTAAPTDAATAASQPATKPVTDKPTDAATQPLPTTTTTMPTTTTTTTPEPTTTMPTTPEPTTIKVTTPEPTKPGLTIHCNSDMIQVVVDRAAAPDLNEQTTHLIDPTCVATANATHLVFETALDACGTTRQETENYIIYSNALDQRVGEISFIGSLDFHCAISRETLVSGTFTPGSAKFGRVINYDPFAFGEYNSEMRFYQDNSYQTELTAPISVSVGDYLYVETRLLSSDKDLRIRATKCVVTTDTSPDSSPQYVAIDNKCPASTSVVQLLASPSSEVQRFSMRAFEFVSNPNSPVYLHCYLLVCSAAPGSPCEDTCARSGKARREAPALGSVVRMSAELPVKNTKLFSPAAAAIAGAVGVIALVGTALVVRRYRKSRHPTDEIDM